MPRLRLPSMVSVVVLSALAALSAGSGMPSGYTITFITDPPGTHFGGGATAVNNKGQVAVVGKGRSYLWSGGKLTDLGPLGRLGVWADDINDRGQIVGHGGAYGPYEKRAFLWERGRMRELPTLGGKNGSAWAINNRGEVVGSADTPQRKEHAVLWVDGEPRDLGTLGGDTSTASGINERGQVVGYSSTAEGSTHAFLWEDGRMKDLGVLPGYTVSTATAINGKGWVIGVAVRRGPPAPPGSIHGARSEYRLFLYRDGVLQELAALAGEHHNAFAMNAAGDVVGVSFATPKGQRAFLNRAGKVTDLTAVLPQGTRGEVYFAKDINDRGQIAAAAKVNGRRRAVLLTPR